MVAVRDDYVGRVQRPFRALLLVISEAPFGRGIALCPEGQVAAEALDATLGLPYNGNWQVAITTSTQGEPSDNQHQLPDHRPCQRPR